MGRGRRVLIAPAIRQEKGFEPPSLHIGGVHLVGATALVPRGRARCRGKGRHSHRMSDGPPDEDEAMLDDYVSNILAQEQEKEEEEDGEDDRHTGSSSSGSGKERRRAHAARSAFERGAHTEVGTQQDGSYLGFASSRGGTSDGDSSSDEERGPGPAGQSYARNPNAITHEVLQVLQLEDGTRHEVVQQLTTAQAFPYFTRAMDEPRGSGSRSHPRRKKSVAMGALGGALAPGEKKRLKKEQMQARRAARDARRGFEVHSIVAQITEFMASGGDMLAIQPGGKHAVEVAVKMVRAAGLRGSVQGAGKRCTVVGRWPDGTAPHPLPPQASAVLMALAEAETAAQRVGAAAGGGVGPSGMAHATPLAAARMGFKHRHEQRSGGTRARSERDPRPLDAVVFVSAGVASMEAHPPADAVPQQDAQQAQREQLAPEDPSTAPLQAVEGRMEQMQLDQGDGPDGGWQLAHSGSSSTGSSSRGHTGSEDEMGEETDVGHTGLGYHQRGGFKYITIAASIGQDVATPPPPAHQLGLLPRDMTAGASPDHLPAASLPNWTKQQAKAAAKKANKQQRRAAAVSAAASLPSAAPAEAAPSQATPSRDLHYTYARFETYTTGIGSRLMRAMGWQEGQGLGASRQGRATPVMPEQRPKNLGLGATGS